MSFITFHSERGVLSQFRYIAGVQLLTKDPKPYTQVVKGNAPLDYRVYIVDCEEVEYDVTDHVQIRNWGDNMIMKIMYLPYDFATSPVRFKIDSDTVDMEPMLSSFFLLTRYRQEFTSRIDYVQRGVDFSRRGVMESSGRPFQSIQLQMYRNNFVDGTEVETYYQITRSQTINERISIKEYLQYATLPITELALSKLAEALYDGMCYIDQVRSYIVEGLDRTEREGLSNISENTFLVDPDDKDIIHIGEIIIEDGKVTVPFLSSSTELSSSEHLSSSYEITI